MNLRELLEERSAPPATLVHDLRMAGVRRKVSTRRRRRLAVVGAAVLALVVAGGTVGAGVAGSGRSVTPAGPAGFAEYHEGNRVVAATSGPLTETELEFTFTPATDGLTLYWRCRVPPPWWHSLISVGDHSVHLPELEVLVNGERVTRWTGEVACATPPDGPDVLVFPETWVDAGITVGEPATVTVRIVGEVVNSTGDPVTLPEDAEWGVAVAEPVPFTQYAFPPRPAPLPELRVPAHGDPALLLTSDPADPTREVGASFAWSLNRGYLLQVGARTPMSLTVLLDGVPVGMVEVWNYHSHCRAGLDLTRDLLAAHGLADLPGRRATLAVRPERIAGSGDDADWYVRLNPPGSLRC